MVIWGGVPLVTKVAVAEMRPDLVGILRTVLGLPLAALMLAVGRTPRVPAGRRVWAMLALTALVSFIGFPVFMSIGQARTSAAHGGLVLGALPIVTGIVAALWDRRPLAGAWVTGAVIAFGGLAALILLAGKGNGGSEATVVGDLWVFASVLSAAVGYVAGTRLVAALGARRVIFWGVVIGGLLLLPWLAWQAGDLDPWAWSGRLWLALLYLAFLAQVLNWGLWFWAMDRAGVARIAAFQFVQPAVTLVLAAVLLGEALTAPLLGSAAVILFGIGLCQFRR